ncbi:protein KRI1 homolog isoform X2 [Penaeus japonicus]|uniref:protein KRI1 homolog isoform X2 n=1 Tax=Penaeus japonicus TaxID=27405 RepID=UPI001C716CAD|nr:protein KRI1 homolog isoform X2 [Penaeus japonicus]
MSLKNIFEDDDVDEGFHINEQYASKYDKWRRNEELQKLKDQYGNVDDLEESESSSSDDEFAEPDNPAFDRAFLRALSALQSKEHSSLKGKPFFSEEDYGTKKKKEKEEKPMTIRDYERHVILDHGGRLKDDEEEEDDSAQNDQKQGPSKEDLINGFKNDIDSSDDDDLFTSGLFKVKDPQKGKKQKEQEDDVFDFVKGKKKSLKDKEDESILKTLRDKWNNPNLSKDEKWLADFFLNQRYLEEEDDTVERAYNETIIDEETLSDDEKTLTKMEDFDREYRFRFEEPDQQFIKSYPRNIEDSSRAKDSKRKEARELYEKRKKEEKEQKRQEIARLKALKYQEIQDKIEKIKQVSGNDDIDFGNDELEDDFDPEAHDAKMADMFGDDYYNMEDEDGRKPVFSDDDDDLKDYDEYVDKYGKSVAGGGADDSERQEEEEEEEEEGEDYNNFDYENFNMDADYDPNDESTNHQQEMIQTSSRVNRRRKSRFALVLKKKKPVFNPEDKDFDSYYDEYYNLDFEDIVGGVPCRYRYRKVEPNDFGLSTEEILSASTDELQKWVPIKRILRHDRTDALEKRDRINYQKRSEMMHIKLKILPSLFAENPDEIQEAEEEKKRQKNLKKKLRRQKKLAEQGIISGEGEPDEEGEGVAEMEGGGKTERSRKKRHLEGNDTSSPRKKRKEKKEEEEEEEVDSVTSAEENTKKKKKKKKKEEEEAVGEENQDTELESAMSAEESTKKKKKKKKEKEEQEEIEGVVEENQKIEIETTASVEESTKKKKKKKKKEVQEEMEGVVEEIQKSEVETSSAEESSKKKKKKRLQEEAVTEENQAPALEESMKKKKKEKKKAIVEETQENQGSEKKKKKKKGAQEQGLASFEVSKPPRKDKPKWKKKDRQEDPFLNGICNARLAAYGANPKKIKNKVKYGKKSFFSNE